MADEKRERRPQRRQAEDDGLIKKLIEVNRVTKVVKGGITIAAASTMDKAVKEQIAGLSKTDAAKVVGTVAAQRAMEKGVKTVVFDRGGYLYTGRVKAVADGAREAGLDF